MHGTIAKLRARNYLVELYLCKYCFLRFCVSMTAARICKIHLDRVDPMYDQLTQHMWIQDGIKTHTFNLVPTQLALSRIISIHG